MMKDEFFNREEREERKDFWTLMNAENADDLFWMMKTRLFLSWRRVLFRWARVYVGSPHMFIDDSPLQAKS